MGWNIGEIEREWGATSPCPEIVVDAFERVEKVLGRDWIALTKLTTAGQVWGPSPLLTVVSMGGRLSVLERVKRAGRLVEKLKNNDRSAEAELTAMHLLYARNKTVRIEYEPESVNGRKADFRVCDEGVDWTYVEVTRPDISDARKRLTSILGRITSLVAATGGKFALEVFFRREPDDEEIEPLLTCITQLLRVGANKRKEVGSLALLILSDETPERITPHHEPGDQTPRLCEARMIWSRGKPSRHVVAGIPYSDKRADKFLSDEAAQLPRDNPGLIMVDVSGEPTAFSSWGAILARRFQPGIHTRVSCVCLFAPQLIPLTGTLIWVPAVQIHNNRHAGLALPLWVDSALSDAANDFGILLRSSRASTQ